MDASQTLVSFLSHTIGQKEVSLLVIETENQMPAIEHALIEAGFIASEHPLKLLHAIHTHQKSFIILGESNAKDLYDVCTQYPTGQISFLNSSKMVSLFIRPEYQDSAIILVVLKNILISLEQKGYLFRSISGMAHQM